MSRGPQTFQQGEVTKLTKAVLAAGLPVGRVEVQFAPDGTRKVVAVINSSDDREVSQAANEWDGAK